MQRLISFLFAGGLILAACSAPAASSDSTPQLASSATLSLPWTPTPAALTPTPQPPEQATPTLPTVPVTSTPGAAFQICSPLAGYTQAQLTEIVSNPYNPPAEGSDDPHQGVDLADRLNGTGMAVTGMGVQAILAGRVVLAQTDRFPYGFAVMVETPLQALPETLLSALPEAAPLWAANPALNCPEVAQPGDPGAERSVYILYAHLQDQPLVQVGEPITCGQVMGAVGQSGNALAPHLHLEIRLGPSGWQAASVAHYTNNAIPEEMGQYCLWRVSGVFQHLDPLAWFESLPNP